MVLGSGPSTIVHDARDALATPERTAGQVLSRFKEQVAMLLFWAAVVLPAIYLAMLVDGIGTTGELRSFLQLLALHVVALLGGRHHG